MLARVVQGEGKPYLRGWIRGMGDAGVGGMQGLVAQEEGGCRVLWCRSEGWGGVAQG